MRTGSAGITHNWLGCLNRHQGKKHLFDDKPSGKDNDWSHNLACRFQRHLNDAGIVGKGRPMIYGMHHTFIDELQQADVAEHIVAEHSKKGLTYGSYGKRVGIVLLKEKVELVPGDMVAFV